MDFTVSLGNLLTAVIIFITITGGILKLLHNYVIKSIDSQFTSLKNEQTVIEKNIQTTQRNMNAEWEKKMGYITRNQENLEEEQHEMKNNYIKRFESVNEKIIDNKEAMIRGFGEIKLLIKDVSNEVKQQNSYSKNLHQKLNDQLAKDKNK